MASMNLQVRVGDEFVRQVDDWRRRQPDLPTRAAAVRLLVERALEAEKVRAEPPSARKNARGG
jgi:hypothetical protein